MSEQMPNAFTLSCPLPINDYDRVLLAHGGGGSLSNQLISNMFRAHFDNELLNSAHDGAVIESNGQKIAFTTDSYVVQPIFFPGGDIGDLAVNGTVNDLACCGARPLYISVAFIIEEGFEMKKLWQVVQSIKKAADRAGVQVVTGDTKVVDKGKGDQIFVNTSGIGFIPEGVRIGPGRCRPGDVVLLSGTLADHGVTIMSKRAGLTFETTIESDTAPLNGLVEQLLDAVPEVHVLRDPTRGGIASALNEIAEKSATGIVLDETAIPITEQVKGACEILGLDPLYIANEGKLLAIVPEDHADRALEAMKNHPLGHNAAIIGRVTKDHPGMVRMTTSIGSTRIVDMISGEQLPRIC